MKVRALVTILATVGLSSASQSGLGNDAIMLGAVSVRLGQAELPTLELLRQTYELRSVDMKPTSSSWSVWTRTPAGVSNVGNVWFEGGRLTGASAGWLQDSEKPRAAAFASAVYGAVRDMVGDAGRSCNVSVGSLDAPTNENKVVTILCGAKQVRIDVQRTQVGDFGSISQIILAPK